MGRLAKLRELRQKRGYTQEQVAELAGLNRSMYTKFETGDRVPDIRQFRRIMTALNVKDYDKEGYTNEADDHDSTQGSEN